VRDFFRQVLGSAPPSGKFGAVQLFVVLGTIFLPIMAAARFELGRASILFSLFLPLVGLVLHFVAVLRAAIKAQRGWGKIFAFTYALLPPLLLGAGMIAVRTIPSLKYKSRQSEAKISLAVIYGAEAWEEEAGRDELDRPVSGYFPEGQKRYYGYGIMRCGNGGKGPVVYWGMGDPQQDVRFEGEIKTFAKDESCEGRPNGFSAFAAGEINPGQGIDVWRINEAKETVHVQSGL
jgi:hypothetical protein